jgi:hypothetical protein
VVGWRNQNYLQDRINWFTVMQPYMLTHVRPHVLTAEMERALKPGDPITECDKGCPEMIVIQAGEFTMGSPKTEHYRTDEEGPRHTVVIAKPFAVSKFEVTFEQWDVCVAVRGCRHVSDGGDGRGTQPVVNVSWDDAQQYVAWFSKMTGKSYRLLSEAEWEYAARAGSETTYSWGNDIGGGNANCHGCGSHWDGKPAPVGSFSANAFGLYDMHGNGARTPGIRTMKVRPLVAQCGKEAIFPSASCVAVPGAAIYKTSAQPTAAGSLLPIVTTISVFELRECCNLHYRI